MSATLYGLGVGPGDPELLTLKALRILRRVPVIAYVHAEGGQSVARAIVDEHLPGGQIEVAFPMPMRVGSSPANRVYDKAAVEIAMHLAEGRDVAVLCEGDPFFYGSFMYLFRRMVDGYSVCVVPGVSSLGAAAAAAGMPLASRSETLTVLPAMLPEDVLAARLAASDAAAIVKVGRHMGKVRRALARVGADRGARYIEWATMEAERVLPLEHIADEDAIYFSMILTDTGGGAGP